MHIRAALEAGSEKQYEYRKAPGTNRFCLLYTSSARTFRTTGTARWRSWTATTPVSTLTPPPVSYTHLDVYKRQILNYICLLGWSPKGEYAEQEIFSLADLVKIWTPDGISKSPAIFDPLKLRAINAEYIRRLRCV